MVPLSRRAVAVALLVTANAVAAGAQQGTSSGVAGVPQHGVVVPPEGGVKMEFCSHPLTLLLKVDSANAPTTQLVAGFGQIRGDEGVGRHVTNHEVVYIRSGWGLAIFGNDTTPIGPGSVVYVSPGRSHRFIRMGREPLDYYWVLGPRRSGAGFRDAARIGCGGPTPVSQSTARAPDSNGPVLIIPPGAGERITYCLFPLTITAKVDSENVATTALTAAAGALRTGVEIGSHAAEEVVLITHGRGRAISGTDTVTIESGSVVHNPGSITHGFINDGPDTLEYFIVYRWETPHSRAGFRRLASRPGPYCPTISSP
jgi:mannose-6-phosphate isomerase-like protein (cupin superfamily)